jgi:hypothetical protein
VEVAEQKKKTKADLTVLAVLAAALGGVDVVANSGCCRFLFRSSLLLSVSDGGGVVVDGGSGQFLW